MNKELIFIMSKIEILRRLATVANFLDNHHMYNDANHVDEVMSDIEGVYDTLLSALEDVGAELAFYDKKLKQDRADLHEPSEEFFKHYNELMDERQDLLSRIRKLTHMEDSAH